MLILTIIFLLLAVGLFIISYIWDRYNYHSDGPIGCAIFGVVFGLLFIFSTAIGIPSGKYDDRQTMRRLRVFQQTLEDQRKAGNSIENATITTQIIEYNQWISEVKRKNTFWRDYLWTDQDVDTLKIIK